MKECERRMVPVRALRHALGLAVFCGAVFAASADEAKAYRLVPVNFADLPGFSDDRLADALKVFTKTCDRPSGARPQVEGFDPAAQAKACHAARAGAGSANPSGFFQQYFRPYLVAVDGEGDAFFTGYYQPEIEASLVKNKSFLTAVYGLPPDLVSLAPSERRGPLTDLTAARRAPDGSLTPYPDRAAIEDGALERTPGVKRLAYVKDNVDLYLAQVQGSARLQLTDGRILRLAFAGKNGQPYTALARILVQRGVASPSEMTMSRLTEWIRENGIERGQAGDDLLRQNRSFVFFNASIENGSDAGPQGGSGAALTPLRSIAVDARVWPYGLLFFIDSEMPWRTGAQEPFRRVVVSQDTGSAIVGPARADIYFGAGAAPGARASEIRHHGRLFVFLPAH